MKKRPGNPLNLCVSHTKRQETATYLQYIQ